jgi:hypothetical protein
MRAAVRFTARRSQCQMPRMATMAATIVPRMATTMVAQQPSCPHCVLATISHSNKINATQSAISRNLVLSQLPVSHAAAAATRMASRITSTSKTT